MNHPKSDMEIELELRKENLDAQNKIHYRFLLWDDMISNRITTDEFIENVNILNSK